VRGWDGSAGVHDAYQYFEADFDFPAFWRGFHRRLRLTQGPARIAEIQGSDVRIKVLPAFLSEPQLTRAFSLRCSDGSIANNGR